MKYIVYQTVNKINGKLYVGVHKTKDPNKFDKYIGCGIYIGDQLKNPKTLYQHALKKYGYSNFIRTTLFEYDEMESAYQKEAEIVDMNWIKNKNTYNTKLGGLYGYSCKSLYQFDYKGNLLKIWNSCLEAIEYFGCGHTRFRDCIKNKYSAFESYWSFSDNINVNEYSKAYHPEIYQFDKEGNFIKTWKSITEISESLGYTKKSVSEAICQEKLYKNCWWTHDKEIIFDVIQKYHFFNTRYVNIDLYTLNGELIDSFDSIKDLAKFLNKKYCCVKNSIRNNRLIDNKYKAVKLTQLSKKTKIQQFDLSGNLVKEWESLSQCAKVHPKCREVLKGVRSQTHGYTFKYIL